jgi:hypothetical protein
MNAPRRIAALAVLLAAACDARLPAEIDAGAASSDASRLADVVVAMDAPAAIDAPAVDGDASAATDAPRAAEDAGVDAPAAVAVDACMRRGCSGACGSVPDGCGGIITCPACGPGLECAASACIPARNRAVTTIDGSTVTDAGLVLGASMYVPASDSFGIYFGSSGVELGLFVYSASTIAPGTHTCGPHAPTLSILRPEWPGGGSVTCAAPPPRSASDDVVTEYSVTITSARASPPYELRGTAHVAMTGAAGSPRAGRALVADVTFAVCGSGTSLTACP